MSSTLLTGPRHRLLDDEAFALAARSAGDEPASVLYITRNDARRNLVEDRWSEEYAPLRLRVETLDGVVTDWFESLAGPAEPLSGQLNRRLAEFALDGATEATATGALAGEPASAALADAFSNRFSLFDDAGITDAEDLASEFSKSELDERISTATVDAFRRFYRLRNEHVDTWTRTRGEMFTTVATADRSLAALSPELDVVVLSGYYEFRPIERTLLQRIVSEFDTIALLPRHQSGEDGVDAVLDDTLQTYEELGFEARSVPDHGATQGLTAVTNAMYRAEPEPLSVPDALTWRELPTAEREVRYVARELRAELAAGRDPDDLAVVVPGTEAYAGYVDDVFDTFEIPSLTTAASDLTRTFAGSIVHDLIALAESDPRVEDLSSLLANALTSIVSQEQADAVTAAARQRDTIGLEPVLDDVDDEIARTIGDLRSELQTLQHGTVDEAVETLRTLVDDRFELESAIHSYASATERVLEERAYGLIDEVLESFETLVDEPTERTPLALFTRAFDGVPLRTPQGSASGRVEVLGLLDARMRAFDRVFVVGLTTEQFPVTPERPAFFEEMTDEHPRFDTADERQRGRYLFATLLANANEVTLTTPETGGDESAVVRSPILDELQRVTGIEPEMGTDDRVGSREDLQRHVAGHGSPRVAVDQAGERGDLRPMRVKRADRGLACAESRSDASLSSHDGVLDAETVAEVYPPSEREPYSASRIERYVECGFKFYAEQVLDIEDPDDVEVTPTPLEAGRYVHDVLERFYADLQVDPGEGVDLTALDRHGLEAHLLDVALDELDDAGFAYEGLFYERWLAELFAGLADDENPYTESRYPHEATENGLFASFLDNELSRDGEGRPTWFEAPFGEGLWDVDTGPFEVERQDGENVSIRGYIDRVDVRDGPDGSRLTLYDYKTGSAPWMTKTTGGTKFQLPIYLLAADDTLVDEGDGVSELSATYYQVRPPNDVKVPGGVESKFDSQGELRRFLEDVVPERLGRIDAAIENGRFHTTLQSPRGANCRYCDYRRACDVRHHRKRERVSEAEDGDATYVPLRARDESLEEVMDDA